MTTQIDSARGKLLTRTLYHAFTTNGILGRNDMPEDSPPEQIERGSLEHILFLTLTVTIDYQRNADELWRASCRSYDDSSTRYLFNPQDLHLTPFQKEMEDMQKYGLSKKIQNDAWHWRTVGVTFYKKWGGDPRNFLANCDWDAPTILNRLKKDTHTYNGREWLDFPYLRGDKIGPLWLRMLRDNAGITEIRNMDKVPIPVDIHIARASLAVGVVRGQYNGSLPELYNQIRQVWFESVRDLSIEGRSMIALDIDEPLWHLSRYGCSDRDKLSGRCQHNHRCEAGEYCIAGVIDIHDGKVRLDT